MVSMPKISSRAWLASPAGRSPSRVSVVSITVTLVLLLALTLFSADDDRRRSLVELHSHWLRSAGAGDMGDSDFKDTVLERRRPLMKDVIAHIAIRTDGAACLCSVMPTSVCLRIFFASFASCSRSFECAFSVLLHRPPFLHGSRHVSPTRGQYEA